jgi:homoserine kinase type II
MDPTLPLARWLACSPPARIEAARPGFSGARVWRVAHVDRRYALRQWPAVFPAARLREIHELQRFLAAQGLPVPAPIRSLDGAMLVEQAGALWELADWRPGEANYREDSSAEKRRAALQMLARIHCAAAEFTTTTGQGGAQFAPAPSIARRHARAQTLLGGELANLRCAVEKNAKKIPDDEQARLAPEALALIEQLLPAAALRLAAWHRTPLPLQWRLGDVHHDHILFVGERVTGVIDFGAAAVDAPVGDVSRLLGSLAGDDRAAWGDGLAAYEQLRPLAPAERDAARLFDASGTILAAANWLHWLLVEPPSVGAPLNRPAAVERLRQLTARLRTQ